MTPLDAAYATVHDVLGGSEALGPRMGMSAAVLRNKVNLHNTTHHLTLAEADRLIALTGDARILHALAQTHAYLCVKVQDDIPASDMAVLEMVTQVWRSNGDVGASVDAVLADGRVERSELTAVRQALYRHQQHLVGLLQRLESMAE
ncbi:phage regulatory CII family protein [Chitinimonas taiwanensis]|uniref:phage regulatory CII family protein n=1 Tax=Chitinimonas taiwanensis TaxID=240412 RepID=UPI0035ADC235